MALKLTKQNGIFNGKKFYAKRLLLDEYDNACRKLLVAIIENNENNKTVFRQNKIEIIEQLLNLKSGEQLVIEKQKQRQAPKYGNGEAA